MPTDVFIDYSRVDDSFDVRAAVERLQRPEYLGAIARRVSCVVESELVASNMQPAEGWTIVAARAVEACDAAIAAAAEADQSLLVLLGDVQPSSAAVGMLLEAVESDPMIGFAAARLSGAAEGSVARLDFSGDAAFDEFPRRLLAELPDSYLVADTPARCLLIKPMVLANFARLDQRFATVAGALWHYMSRARRCGFRTLVCNRAVVSVSRHSRSSVPSTITARYLPEADRVLLRELSPDVERTAGEFGTATAAVSETRLARGLHHAYGSPLSLLLDLRNIVTGMNGTTAAALGICGGLHSLQLDWDITVLAGEQASTFHNLKELFPGWTVATKLPARQYSVAFRLSQPWHIQEMIDLHAAAAYNAYLFLDTISWDVVYSAPRNLDGTWQFLVQHADALLFNSAYTRDRLNRRFPFRPGMPELIAYHSFDPAEYARADLRMPAKREPFIFIVGNEYDHKDVGPTMDLLATAFPYESIVALGPSTATTPRVRVLRSGNLSELEIHRLYAGARAVVFPSFYEGFGFPVLTTLAYGGTVVARRSALLDEIAARSAPRGRIVPFARRDDLVDVVGRILHGEDVEELPLGTALQDGEPMSWRAVADGIATFVANLASDLSRSQWRARERAIMQLVAAPISLNDKGLNRPFIRSA